MNMATIMNGVNVEKLEVVMKLRCENSTLYTKIAHLNDAVKKKESEGFELSIQNDKWRYKYVGERAEESLLQGRCKQASLSDSSYRRACNLMVFEQLARFCDEKIVFCKDAKNQ